MAVGDGMSRVDDVLGCAQSGGGGSAGEGRRCGRLARQQAAKARRCKIRLGGRAVQVGGLAPARGNVC